MPIEPSSGPRVRRALAEGGGLVEPSISERVAADKLRDLETVTDAALSYLPLEQLLDELLLRVIAILGVDTAAILLLEDDDRTLVARAAKGLEEEVERGVRIPVGRGFAGRIAAAGKPMRIDDIEHAEILNPILRERGLKSLLGIPLIVEGAVIGVLHVGALQERSFNTDDVALLQRAGDRAALAIHGRLTERERGLADAMQRSLIPRLPEIPGIAMAGRYMPAAAARLGGDWYDAFLLPSGHLALAIGDVVGRGFHAAALMGQLRSGLRAYALEGAAPSRVLERLSDLLRQIDNSSTATLLFMVADPFGGEATFATAGHPPPLVALDGSAEFVGAAGSVPLGAVRSPRYRDAEIALPSGATLVLYTDGVVEQATHDIEAGMTSLRGVAAGADGDGDLEVLCDAIADRLLPDGAERDDAALLVLRPDALPDHLSLRLPAEFDSVPLMRRLLSHWLAKEAVDRHLVEEIALACSEAFANAAEHAYSPARSYVELGASVSEGTAVLTVRDFGRWRVPRGAHRGRGLLLMEGLMDSVDLRRGEDGTTVRMTKRVAAEERP